MNQPGRDREEELGLDPRAPSPEGTSPAEQVHRIYDLGPLRQPVRRIVIEPISGRPHPSIDMAALALHLGDLLPVPG